jgi:polynucleotide 5'-hydroxyl-kinase GRC3/NOL9
VIGAPDRGKSSFCEALLGALLAQGTKASLLDTALGEKTIGPPACLTLGLKTAEGYDLKDLYFVGGLDSARRMPVMIAGAARLTAVAEGRLVVDTGGTVNAPGRVLKGLKIDALRPDHIVAIGHDEELEPFLALKPQSLIHRLPAGDGVQPRNFMTRALNRLRAFQAVLDNAQTHELHDLAVEPWDEDAFDWTQGEYICGLADADGKEHGIGILTRADAMRGIFQITTTVAPDLIHRVRVGMSLPDELKA